MSVIKGREWRTGTFCLTLCTRTELEKGVSYVYKPKV